MKELPKVYDPKQVESKIYDMWMRGGYFAGKADPPNIRISWDYHPTFMLILERVLRSFTHL